MDSERKITETPQQLMVRLQIPFEDILLLTRALTHRSYLNEHPDALEDNERLEFLGDAVLDFLVGEWLYNRFPEMEEGGLTQMRSAFVQTGQLAAFAREIHLDKAIRLGWGELKSGGKLRNALLCDVFEAFIGALLLEKGIEYVKSFIYPLLEGALNEIVSKRKNEDPKSLLQEWAQAKGYPPPKYRTINVKGPDHAKVFEVEARVNNQVVALGEAMSKQAAEKSAAKIALEKIQKENNLHV
jgi:ribonuclease III